MESAFGDRGLALAELLAVAAALTILARDARHARQIGGNAGSQGIAGALALATVGAFASLTVVRVQLFSLLLFPLLVALLRAQARAPSARLWLALPLLAIWSNLHGAALSGLVILEAYLLLSRIRTETARTVAVALLAPVALCLTPAGIRTIAYYHGLTTNVAAERGLGQWAPLGTGALDLVLIAAAAALAVRAGLAIRAGRWRPSGWETVVVLVFAALTVKAARDGVWLLFLLVAPAAQIRTTTRAGAPRRAWNGFVIPALIVAVPLLVLAVARAPRTPGASPALVQRAVAIAHGRPILADSVAAEQVALAGGRIWAGNPLDAFTRVTQLAYLDWVDGSPGDGRILANRQIAIVLASRGSAADATTAADPRFRQVADDATAVLFERR